MTIVSSGRLRLGLDPASPSRSIASEFGGNAGNYQLSDYYAGGAFVPAGTTGINGPIPTAGRIAIDDFYNSSSLILNVTTRNASVSSNESLVTCYFEFGVTGILKYRAARNTIITVPNEWVIGSPVNNLSDSYQFRFITQAQPGFGNPNYFFPSGININIWYDLLSPYIRCGTQRSTNGSTSSSFLVQIRGKGSSEILVSSLLTTAASKT